MHFIRNIAIIAHVDHGKTTLVDELLKQSGTFQSHQKVDERVMDSMDLEKEKGITIRAKNASFHWKGYQVNIVDTPGHADFGGEVERIMKMVDGVLLLVDAHDGPQAQTRFVLRKALENDVKPLVVINKVDRENARPHKVLDMIFDLFIELNATDAQLDFPVIYASAKDGYAMRDIHDDAQDFTPLFEAIAEHIPAPPDSSDTFFRMIVANLDYSDYLGRIAYGKIVSGRVAKGETVVCIHRDGSRERGTVTALFGHKGLKEIEIENASAGQIVGLSGFETVFIGETIADSEERPPLPFMAIDPPTLRMNFVVNDSPMAGREGKFLTARHLWERLVRETRGNVSLQVSDTQQAGVYEVRGRGQMQIAVLVEQMRREGYELMVSRPEVIWEKDENGALLEPIETLYLEVPQECLGDALQSLAARKAEIINMDHHAAGVTVEAAIPTRGLIGFETEAVNLSKGRAVMSHLFREYAPHKGEIQSRRSGALIAMEAGTVTAYALNTIQNRGRLFVAPGDEVYEGMVVGENSRSDDLVVNPCKAKHLTNMRSQGDGKGIMLEPPVLMNLERSLEFIADDEYVETTPAAIRLRKRVLDATARKRSKKT